MQEQEDRDTVIAVVTKFMNGMGRSPDFRIACEKLEGGCARVLVKDMADHLTPLYGFVQCKDGKWTVLSMGTFFDPEFYQLNGIPPTMHLR